MRMPVSTAGSAVRSSRDPRVFTNEGLLKDRQRAASLDALVGSGADLVIGELADRDGVRRIAAEVAAAPPLDAVIHDAGVWSGPPVMPVNVIAPYLLTA